MPRSFVILLCSSSRMTRGCQLLAMASSTTVYHDRQPVADVTQWAVAPFRTMAREPRVARDDVGLEAVAIGEVAAQHALVRIKPGLLHNCASMVMLPS